MVLVILLFCVYSTTFSNIQNKKNVSQKFIIIEKKIETSTFSVQSLTKPKFKILFIFRPHQILNSLHNIKINKTNKMYLKIS